MPSGRPTPARWHRRFRLRVARNEDSPNRSRSPAQSYVVVVGFGQVSVSVFHELTSSISHKKRLVGEPAANSREFLYSEIHQGEDVTQCLSQVLRLELP